MEGVHWNARGHQEMARLLERIHKGTGEVSTASAYPTAREPAVS
jgi:hypothetical protein